MRRARRARNRAGAAVAARYGLHLRARHLLCWATGLLLLLGFGGVVPAAGNDPWQPFLSTWFDHVTVAEGLPHPTTTSITQDSRGLIWLGTIAGLVRYDGYRMQVFGGGAGSANLSDAYVRALAALPNGGLLVGTNGGGLLRFDAATQLFHRYPIGPTGTASAKIYAIAPDPSEPGTGFWIASEGGLDHLDAASDTFRHEAPTEDTPHEMASRIFSVLQDGQGNLWVGNNAGLFERAAGSKDFVRATDADPALAAVLRDQPWALAQDHEGRLWVGTLRSGVIYRDAQQHWHAPATLVGSDSLIRHRTVRAFLVATDGSLWVATDGAGVVVYDPSNGQARSLMHDPAVASTLDGNIERALLQDRSGNIWVATELGAAVYDPHPRAVLSVLSSPLEANALAMPDVHCIYVDARGRIWLGLGMGRIDVLDLPRGSMHHIQLTGAQADLDVQALVMAEDGSMWAGSQGVARIDPDTFQIHNAQLPMLEGQPILFMQRDGTRVLIGTYDGIYRYDMATAQMEHFRHDQADPNSLISNQVRNSVRLPGAWWYLTANGISIAEDNASHFRTLRNDPADPHSLPQNYVNSVAADARGRLWVGTYSGLAWTDDMHAAGGYHFERLGIEQGLENAKVNALLIDPANRVWVSMENGLAVVDPALKVRMLGARDGLHLLNYVLRSAAITPQGDLLFGGLGGLTVLRPQALQSQPSQPSLAITYASTNRRVLSFAELPEADGSLTLGPQERSLHIDFSLLDYRALAETRYSYRMRGLESEWTEIPRGTPPTVIYTNLPHGSYTLQLRATTKGIDGSEIEASVRIVVEPRWYETALVSLGLVLFGMLAFFGLVYLRTRYLRQRAVALQEQVDLRTRDLKLANARLDQLAGTDELTGAHNRRRFLELTERIRERAETEQDRFCLLLIDLDEFKQVNDNYGHLAGDQVIRTAVQTALLLCRSPALLGRYGGEELVICLPDVDGATAQLIGERICKALADVVVVFEDHTIRITASVGVAAWRSPESLQSLLGRADKALYAAKRSGRNRCVLAED